ncbi:MAG TPA: DUF5367 family protein [Blastocatellia bacterium]|nr:DUF5367 family protein [Blastocatellia bacterium]
MNKRLLLYGIGMWLSGTAVLRLAGERLLHPGNWKSILILFGLSFVLTGWLVRRLCGGLPQERVFGGAISLVLPTLLFDPFSSAFFTLVFPNIDPNAAGLFGGWMLCCCGGALAGALLPRRRLPSQ